MVVVLATVRLVVRYALSLVLVPLQSNVVLYTTAVLLGVRGSKYCSTVPPLLAVPLFLLRGARPLLL